MEIGFLGEAIVRALILLAVSEGYCADFGSDSKLIFCHENGLLAKDVEAALEVALRRCVFDAEMFEKYGILTSETLQNEFFKTVKRRKKIAVNENYILGKAYEQYCKNIPENKKTESSEDLTAVTETEIAVKGETENAVEGEVRGEPENAVEGETLAEIMHRKLKADGVFKESEEVRKRSETFKERVRSFFGPKYSEFAESVTAKNGEENRLPSEKDIKAFEASWTDAPLPEDTSPPFAPNCFG